MTAHVHPPPADQAQLLVPHPHRHYPFGLVVGRDAHRGLRIECLCGLQRWTVYGQAQQHAMRCPLVAVQAWRSLGARGTPPHAVLMALGRNGATAAQAADRLRLSAIRVRALLRILEREGLAVRSRKPPHLWRAK